MKNETTTEIKQELLDIFFKMDRVESTQHTFDSVASLYAQSNEVSDSLKTRVRSALIEMCKEGTLVMVHKKRKVVRFMDSTLKLNDELYQKYLTQKLAEDETLTEGYRSFGREFGYKQNVSILCGMEANLFRFC